VAANAVTFTSAGRHWVLRFNTTGVNVSEKGSRHVALDMGCATCHVVHKTGEARQREVDFHLTKGVPQLCLDCHDAGDANLAATHQGQPFAKSDCLTCHDPHESRAPKLLQKFAHQPFADKSCDVCHQPARAGASPSLRANALDLNGNPSGRSLAAGTYLNCSDCHNNDNARALGGAAANGPHGSRYEHILERRYELEPVPATPGASTLGVSYAPGLSVAYALCDKCHDVDNALLSSDTVFGRHQMHVVGQRASCATRHAPHGVQGGNPHFNAHLLNPDIRIVGPNQFGVLRVDTAARTCSLACHGKDHSNTAY